MMNLRSVAAAALLVVLTFCALVCAQDAPTIKWKRATCFGNELQYCETGWYSSAAVVEDGAQSAIFVSSYHVYRLDSNGNEVWKVEVAADVSDPDGGVSSRTWPGVVLCDLLGNGQLAVVTAHGEGYVSAYDLDGNFLDGWPKRPFNNELRSLAVGDLENNGGALQVAVGVARGDDINMSVLDADGGWSMV
mmetsp:Transcript_18650/g.55878  ORF Transcript_18650/g.55878 Transcript_18650/m.55878 type:complete len:191 (+) Transcript_18650:76-648(+)